MDLDFWTHPSHVGGSVDIRVTAVMYPRLAKLLSAGGIIYPILIPDVQTLKHNENPAPAFRSGRIGFDYNRYYRLSPVRE